MFTTLQAVLAQSFCDSAVRVYSEKGSVLLGDIFHSVLHTLLTWRDPLVLQVTAGRCPSLLSSVGVE